MDADTPMGDAPVPPDSGSEHPPPTRRGGKGKGHQPAARKQKGRQTSTANPNPSGRPYLPDNQYHGFDSLEQVVSEGSYARPDYWPRDPENAPVPYTEVEASQFPVSTDPAKNQAFAARMNKMPWRADNAPYRLISQDIIKCRGALVAYLGFRNTPDFLYFVDCTMAPTVKPFMEWLAEKEFDKKPIQVNTFFQYALMLNDDFPFMQRWLEEVKASAEYFGFPQKILAEIQNRKSEPELVFAYLATVLRLLKAYPTVFRHSKEYCEGKGITVSHYVLGHSTEDMHRAFLLVRFFAQRRTKGSYRHGVALQNDKVNPEHLTVYNPEPASGQGPEAGPDTGISDEYTHDGLFNELVAGFGMDPSHHAKMYRHFERLPEEQKVYYNFAHVEALQKCRNQLSMDSGNNKRVSSMGHLTEDEKSRLLDTCAQRIYIHDVKKLDGLSSQDPSVKARLRQIDIANHLVPDQFKDDALIDQERALLADDPEDLEELLQELRNSYVSNIADLQGGNATEPYSVEEALRMVGFEPEDAYDRLYINEESSKKWKYKIHQVYQIAELKEKLMYFPYTGFLCSACGIGKTIIAFGTMKKMIELGEAVRRNQDSMEEVPREKRIKFAPKLLLAPVASIESHFLECVSAFSGVLYPKMYYGTGDSQTSPISVNNTIPNGALKDFLDELSPDNPKTARTLIISSYNTFKRRCFAPKVHTEAQFLKNAKLRMQLGAHIFHHAEYRWEEEDGDYADLEELVGEEPEEDEDDEDAQMERNLRAEEADADKEEVPQEQLPDEMDVLGGRSLMPGLTAGGADRQRRQKTYTTWAPKFEFEFSMVVCDEAHLLKNKNSSIHKVKISGATCSSHGQTPWPTRCPRASHMPASTERARTLGIEYFDDFARTGFLEKGEGLREMLKPGLRLSRQDPEFAKHVRCITSSRSKPLVYESCPRYEDVKEAAENGRHPWLINPCNSNLALREFGFDFAACRMIVMPALNELLVKRGMESTLTLPNGEQVTPGQDISGAAFRIARVHFHPSDQAKYNQIYDQWKQHLYVRSDRSDGTPARMNPSSWRHCGLPAVNLLNEALLTPRSGNAALYKHVDIEIDPDDMRGGSGKKRGPGPKSRPGLTAEGRANLNNLSLSTPSKPGASQPSIGLRETLAISKLEDGGATFLFNTLRPAPNLPAPRTRFDFIYYLVWNSPIFCAVLRQLYEWVNADPDPMDPEKKHRVVIMGQMPWVLQDMLIILQLWGYEVAIIRSDMHQDDRNRIIQAFNNPNSKFQVLLTSIELSAFALNLQWQSCKGMVIQWPWSINHLLQVLGRLIRLGQTRFVEWIIYTVPNTIYDRLEGIIWKKYVRQLAVESSIPRAVTGPLADVAAHSLIQRMFNQTCHRYLWDRDLFGIDRPLLRHEEDGVRRLALFFEKLGDFLITAVDDDSSADCDLADISQMAAMTPTDLLGAACEWLWPTDHNTPSCRSEEKWTPGYLLELCRLGRANLRRSLKTYRVPVCIRAKLDETLAGTPSRKRKRRATDVSGGSSRDSSPSPQAANDDPFVDLPSLPDQLRTADPLDAADIKRTYRLPSPVLRSAEDIYIEDHQRRKTALWEGDAVVADSDLEEQTASGGDGAAGNGSLGDADSNGDDDDDGNGGAGLPASSDFLEGHVEQQLRQSRKERLGRERGPAPPTAAETEVGQDPSGPPASPSGPDRVEDEDAEDNEEAEAP
ncbi:hypothetical protein DL771_001223 [Monosporascus sp. 5C6A]|nr:hypothetical protein DL771_001223 [Monosporascus sp. 5C6A]